MDNQLIVALDGDNAGRMVGRSVLADDIESLNKISSLIEHGQEVVRMWAESVGGKKISGGGDEAVLSIPEEAVEQLEHLRKDYEFTTGLTTSVGVGKTLSEAGKSLLAAKFRGKNQIVMYDDSVEQDITNAKENLENGTASSEEKKLGEAYLSPEDRDMKKESDMKESDLHDCEYCRQLDTHGEQDEDHCRYCHDNEDEADCQYCKATDEEVPEHEHVDGEPCPYCDPEYNEEQENPPPEAEESQNNVEETGEPNVKNPTTTSSENYEGQDLNPPGYEKTPGDRSEIGLAPNFEAPTTNNNDKLEPQGGSNEEPSNEVPEKGEESEKSPEENLEAVIGENEGSEESNEEIMDQITDEDLAVGHNSEDNISRPDDFADEAPQDMGLAEDEVPEESPDLSQVLHEGLDSHADNIQRERVVSLVSEALEGFKASKEIMERAKEQAPQLYQSSIAMLRAMIEMAKMLGLDQEAEQEADAAPEEMAPEETPEEMEQAPEESEEVPKEGEEDGHPNYDNLFPAHPDVADDAAPQEGAAPVPKPNRQ